MLNFRSTTLYKKTHPFWRRVRSVFILVKSRHTDYFHPVELAKIHCIYLGKFYTAKHGNYMFGNERVIRDHFGKDFMENCMIEHGLYFGRYVITEEVEDKDVSVIYTYSDYRKSSIIDYYGKEIKPIITIGPYIRFAHNFKSKSSLKAIKRKFGKVLLVFPVHGYPGATFKYDILAFLDFIASIATDYDTVMVSMTGADLSQGHDVPFRAKGYVIVSSGNREDQFFLSRQRDLIELADMTISNDIGTHIGYCLCLGKPHSIFKQDVFQVNANEVTLAEAKRDCIMQEEKEELCEAFSSTEPKISPQQLEIVHKYWGPF